MYNKNNNRDIIDAINDNLSEGKLLSPQDQARLARLRTAHTFWMSNPIYSDTMMRDYLMRNFSIGKTQAYSDIAIIKATFGSVQKADKEFQRFRANHLLELATAAALAGNDKKAKQLAKIAETIGKVNQLDEPEGETFDWDALVPKDFSFSIDPEVIGIEREPNVMEKSRKLLKQYIQDIEPDDQDGDSKEISE